MHIQFDAVTSGFYSLLKGQHGVFRVFAAETPMSDAVCPFSRLHTDPTFQPYSSVSTVTAIVSVNVYLQHEQVNGKAGEEAENNDLR